MKCTKTALTILPCPLEEAQSFRKVNKDAPLLCLHPVHLSRIEEAKRLNLTIAVNELDYLKRLLDLNIDCNFKVHLQIDTGFNRLGFKDKDEVKTAVDMINGSNFVLEGIYQHFATAGIFDPHWDEQVRNFKELTSLIDLKKIPIVHMGSSVSMLTHPKQPFTTGVRMGIAIYGYNVAPILFQIRQRTNFAKCETITSLRSTTSAKHILM